MAYLNADEFLGGIIGKTEDHEIPGVGTILIRSLDYADVRIIEGQAKGDNLLSALLMAQACIVEPKLSKDQLQQLEKGLPGVIGAISTHAATLSGLRDADIEKKAGDGSS